MNPFKRLLLIVISLSVFLMSVIYVLFFYEKVKILPLKHPWEKALPSQKVPDGLVSLRAEDCGTCHKEIYKEWKLATHAHAWTDLQFQAELKKDSSPFMCINCHTPLQNQQEYIVEGLINGDIYRPLKKKNPGFDPRLQREGITCASCHVRDKAIVGVNGYEGTPHKTIKDPKMLSESLCLGCHNANAVITPTLACTFQTGDEWKAGPYHDEKNCIDCHMSEVNRPIVEGYPLRKSHRHFFTGSGIPKFDSVQTTVQNGLSFYPDGPKEHYRLGEEMDFKLKVKNEHAGHRVPTGDPERFFLIKLQLVDPKGGLVNSEQFRIGEEWKWYPKAIKLSDNNLNPKEERVYSLKNKLSQIGNYKLSVKITKHRLSKENAEYNKLGNDYPLFITIYEKEEQFEVIN